MRCAACLCVWGGLDRLAAHRAATTPRFSTPYPPLGTQNDPKDRVALDFAKWLESAFATPPGAGVVAFCVNLYDAPFRADLIGAGSFDGVVPAAAQDPRPSVDADDHIVGSELVLCHTRFLGGDPTAARLDKGGDDLRQRGLLPAQPFV